MSQEFENEFEVELEAEDGFAADADATSEAEPAAEEDIDLEPELEVSAAPISTSFGTVTDRLSEIAEVMEDESLPLDDALDLLEEAVALGMQASSLLETDMNERDAAEEAAEEAADAALDADTEDETTEGGDSPIG